MFAALNELPKAQQAVTSIMRIRAWALEGAGAAFRQTVVLSSFAFPEASALLGRRCSNWAGRAVLRSPPQVPPSRPTTAQFSPPASASHL